MCSPMLCLSGRAQYVPGRGFAISAPLLLSTLTPLLLDGSQTPASALFAGSLATLVSCLSLKMASDVVIPLVIVVASVVPFSYTLCER